MHAVHIRSTIAAGEETAIDPRRRLSTFRIRAKTQPDLDRESTSVEDRATRTRQRAARARSSRLSDLRVSESVARRAARRVSTVVANPAQERGEAVALVRLAWVRCEDSGLDANAMGADGILLQGVATGQLQPGRRRPPSSAPNAGPALSVGVDGLMYSVRLSPGDTPALIARKLSKRLRKKFLVEVKHQGEGVTLLRLTSERLGRR